MATAQKHLEVLRSATKNPDGSRIVTAIAWALSSLESAPCPATVKAQADELEEVRNLLGAVPQESAANAAKRLRATLDPIPGEGAINAACRMMNHYLNVREILMAHPDESTLEAARRTFSTAPLDGAESLKMARGRFPNGSDEVITGIADLLRLASRRNTQTPTCVEREEMAAELETAARSVGMPVWVDMLRKAANMLRLLPPDSTPEAQEEARKHRAVLRLMWHRTEMATPREEKDALCWAAFSMVMTKPEGYGTAMGLLRDLLKDKDPKNSTIANAVYEIRSLRKTLEVWTRDREESRQQANELDLTIRDILQAMIGETTLEAAKRIASDLRAAEADLETVRKQLEGFQASASEYAMARASLPNVTAITDEIQTWHSKAVAESNRPDRSEAHRERQATRVETLESVLGLFAVTMLSESEEPSEPTEIHHGTGGITFGPVGAT